MSNRRLLCRGKSVDLKNIKASLTVGYQKQPILGASYGFFSNGTGAITPNPLSNGIKIVEMYVGKPTMAILHINPTNIKVTINNVYLKNGDNTPAISEYLKANNGKTIPIIFHFD